MAIGVETDGVRPSRVRILDAVARRRRISSTSRSPCRRRMRRRSPRLAAADRLALVGVPPAISGVPQRTQWERHPRDRRRDRRSRLLARHAARPRSRRSSPRPGLARGQRAVADRGRPRRRRPRRPPRLGTDRTPARPRARSPSPRSAEVPRPPIERFAAASATFAGMRVVTAPGDPFRAWACHLPRLAVGATAARPRRARRRRPRSGPWRRAERRHSSPSSTSCCS